MEARTNEGQLTKPVIELKKHKGFDLLINTRKEDHILEGILNIRDDEPIESGWTPHRHVTPTIWTRELGGKKYVLKQRSQANHHQLRNFRARIKEEPRHMPYDPRIMNALNSLSQEIDISADVQEITASDEAQRIAQAKGFRSLELVEPLMGIIEKNTKRKFMIYPYVEGQILAYLGYGGIPPIIRIHWQDADEMAEELQALYRKNGIIPQDLDARQLIVSPGKEGPTLSLIDIEQFYKAKTPVRNSVLP